MGPFEFHLGDDALEVKMLGRTLRKVKYDNVDTAYNGYAFWNEYWTNVSPMKFITIRRKTGLIKNFVINPANRGSVSRGTFGKSQKP